MARAARQQGTWKKAKHRCMVLKALLLALLC
jgi:hypothetical protein